jgi:O-antigen ligase
LGDRTPAYSETVSTQGVLRLARGLRALDRVLEGLLWLVIAGSVSAMGAVHPWAYASLWGAAAGIGLLLIVRSLLITRLGRVLGRRPFAFHLSGRWLVVEPSPEYPDQGWGLDLRRSLALRAPLLLPGVAFLLWVVVELLPIGPGRRPLTASVEATERGLAFVASLLVLHLAATVVFERREARERFRRFVAVLGLALGLEALLQLASGTTRIYGFYKPLEYGAIFGPFVNRNHFAGYMLMVTFTTFGLLARAVRRYRRRLGPHSNLRRRMVALSTPEGTRLLYVLVPAAVAVASLVATTSRGGLGAFLAGLVIASHGVWRRQAVPVWGLAVAFLLTALSWFGTERLGIRLNEATADAPGRTLVWKDSLARMSGHWLTGTGFNTFGLSMSHTTPWALPRGATPWPAEIEAAVKTGERPGTRALPGLATLNWYREAHNDYLQTLVETGIPGLVIALAAAAAAFRAVRGDPWLLAAVTSVLVHAVVDFDLQIPAIPVLLVSLVALHRPESTP